MSSSIADGQDFDLETSAMITNGVDDTDRQPASTFSDLIDECGMGPFQTRLIALCGMGWLIDAIEILVIAFVLDDIAYTFQLNGFSKGLVGSASFFGMLFGAMFWSVYADRRGRRTAFVLSLGCTFVAGVASSLAPSFLFLLASRVLVGFGVGGNLPVTSALLTEFLPTSHRAAVLCYVTGAFWGCGLTSASLLGLLLSNVIGLGPDTLFWRWFLGLSALPAAIVGVAYRLLPESPRFLSVAGRHDEAQKVLEAVARANGKADVLGLGKPDPVGEEAESHARLHVGFSSDDPAAGYAANAGGSTPFTESPANGFQHEGSNASDILQGGRPTRALYRHPGTADGKHAGDVRELFHSPILRRVTLCVWMVWVFANISYFGLTFLLPVYYEEVTGGRDDLTYILTGLIGILFIPAASLSLWLCSEDRLGRVGGLKWSSFAAAIFILAMGLCHRIPLLFVPTSVVAVVSLAVPSIIKYVITPELYATKYRAVGLGSASVMTRLGGVLAPVVAVVLYEKGPLWPLAVFCPTMVLTGIFAAMIPVETAGRKLDDDDWDSATVAPEGGGMGVTFDALPSGAHQ